MSRSFSIRRIEPRDNAAVAAVIREVMPQFGACGPGFAITDPEVDTMYEAYARAGHVYFVLEMNGRVVGGGGVAPLAGVDDGTCELRKMYFLEVARGQGQGERMLTLCLSTARELGYRRCYLETLRTMTSAMRLYERLGFQPLGGPLGATGHFGCDRWYALTL